MYALIITLAGSGINEESGTNGNARFIIKNNYYKAEKLWTPKFGTNQVNGKKTKLTIIIWIRNKSSEI